jgi:hypothetical protein
MQQKLTVGRGSGQTWSTSSQALDRVNEVHQIRNRPAEYLRSRVIIRITSIRTFLWRVHHEHPGIVHVSRIVIDSWREHLRKHGCRDSFEKRLLARLGKTVWTDLRG